MDLFHSAQYNLFTKRPAKKESDIVFHMNCKEKGELTYNDFSATVPCTTSEILKVVICSIPKNKPHEDENIQWIQIMFRNISDALSRADAMYVHKKMQFNHFKKKTSEWE